MKSFQRSLLLITFAATGFGLSACQSSSVDKKAQELLHNGTARDMAEARQMAKDHYWPESARKEEAERKREQEAVRPKK